MNVKCLSSPAQGPLHDGPRHWIVLALCQDSSLPASGSPAHSTDLGGCALLRTGAASMSSEAAKLRMISTTAEPQKEESEEGEIECLCFCPGDEGTTEIDSWSDHQKDWCCRLGEHNQQFVSILRRAARHKRRGCEYDCSDLISHEPFRLSG